MRRSWTMVKSEADLLNSQRSTRNKRLGPAVGPYSITEAYNSHSEHTKKGNAHGEDNGSLYYAPDKSHLLFFLVPQFLLPWPLKWLFLFSRHSDPCTLFPIQFISHLFSPLPPQRWKQYVCLKHQKTSTQHSIRTKN
jgi:hypothetical protein